MILERNIFNFPEVDAAQLSFLSASSLYRAWHWQTLTNTLGYLGHYDKLLTRVVWLYCTAQHYCIDLRSAPICSEERIYYRCWHPGFMSERPRMMSECQSTAVTSCLSVEFWRLCLTFLVWIKLQFTGVLTDRHRDDVVLILIIWFPSVRPGFTRGQFFSDDTRTDLSNSSSDPACLNEAKHWLAKTEEGEEWGETLPSARILYQECLRRIFLFEDLRGGSCDDMSWEPLRPHPVIIIAAL